MARAQSGAMPYRGKYCGTRFNSPAIALAPANHRITTVIASYAVPTTGPKNGAIFPPSPWAMYARARSAAGGFFPRSIGFPAASYATSWFGSISVLTTNDDPSRKTDMTTAAVMGKRPGLRVRPARHFGSAPDGAPT